MRVFSFFMLLLCAMPLGLVAEGDIEVEPVLKKAEAAFQANKYQEALRMYEEVYATGAFTEAMLYRMASAHELRGEYGMAVYYLKKAEQEYGNELLDDKIRELMLNAGSSRTFSGSGYVTFYRFFKGWGGLFWILFGITGLLLAADLLLPRDNPPLWRQIGGGSLWFLFVALFVLHTYNVFFTPDRAVLVEPTSFYEDPGYGADSYGNVFGQGETLNILAEQDIWFQVEAGGEKWWVPKWTLKRL